MHLSVEMQKHSNWLTLASLLNYHLVDSYSTSVVLPIMLHLKYSLSLDTIIKLTYGLPVLLLTSYCAVFRHSSHPKMIRTNYSTKYSLVTSNFPLHRGTVLVHQSKLSSVTCWMLTRMKGPLPQLFFVIRGFKGAPLLCTHEVQVIAMILMPAIHRANFNMRLCCTPLQSFS